MPCHYYGTVILCLHYQCLETHSIQFDMAAVSGWGGIHPSVRHAKTRHFLLPPGGAVILSHDFCVGVIRLGLLSYMSSLDLIGPNMSEIQNLVFWWRVIKLWRHATVTPCDEKSIFELVFISILLWWHSSYFEVDQMKALGQVRQSKNVEYSQNGHWMQNGWLSVAFFIMLLETFLCVWTWYTCVSIFREDRSKWTQGLCIGGAVEPFCHAHFKLLQNT